jgi:zinc protease
MTVSRAWIARLVLLVLALGPVAVRGEAWQRERGKTAPPLGPPRPVRLPQIHERTLVNGLRVIFVENHQQPIVSMMVLVRAGAAEEPADRAGLAELLASLLTAGTSTRKSNEISETIDFIGGTLGAQADWDNVLASVKVLANRASTGAELLSDVVVNPAFKADEIERARAQKLSRLQLTASATASTADQVLTQIVLATPAYAHPKTGTATTVGAITRDDLVRFHKTHFTPGNAILAISGDLKRAEAFQLAEKHFGSWPKGPSHPAPKPTVRQAGEARILLVDKPDASQTDIRIGFSGIQRTDPDYYAALVANAVLGGSVFSSRILNELRVKRGLTYGAYSQIDARVLGGALTIATDAKAESTAEAVQIILAEVERLRAEDVPGEELKARKDFLAGNFSMSLSTMDNLLVRLLRAEMFGSSKEYLETYTTRLNAVTAADVRRVAQTRLVPEQMVVVLVGDASKFEESLRGLGPIEKVPYGELNLFSDTLR